MPQLLPGTSHPYAPCDANDIAELLHIEPSRVRSWIDRGLPTRTDGLIDPFACTNWICWGHLDECPALARRWRTYLTFFAPFVAGQDRQRHVAMHQARRLYVPGPAQRVFWWLPQPVETANQRVQTSTISAPDGWVTTAEKDWWHCSHNNIDGIPVINLHSQLAIEPVVDLSLTTAERDELTSAMKHVAGEFTYGYRHHELASYRDELEDHTQSIERWDGTCLDCAMTLGHVLNQGGRRWRVVAGVVAHSVIANPHFWIEVETIGGQWLPLDPSLPAIVRMVGGDWQRAVEAWTGRLDARRITLGVLGEGIGTMPDGITLGSRIGEAVVDGNNAWSCIDWVCGDCEIAFVNDS